MLSQSYNASNLQQKQNSQNFSCTYIAQVFSALETALGACLHIQESIQLLTNELWKSK